jgi:transposase
MGERTPCPTDLSDEQWTTIEPLLPKRDGRGRKPQHNRHELLNAVLYLNRTGCQWRMLPHDFPAWEAVYAFWRRLVKRQALSNERWAAWASKVDYMFPCG